MNAHVWGPRYLLDHLLPQFRVSGWTPDWYDGFPAYQFYMVVPSLFVVAIHVGLVWYLAIPAAAVLLGVAFAAWVVPRLYPYRYLLAVVCVIGLVLVTPVPYTRAFKIVTALGLLSLPFACWAFAKLADLPFPIPPLAVGAGLLFVYNREPIYNTTGNIIGGNFQSTMAGEFAFSISLTFAILYLGVAIRGLRTGRHRALAAVLFALAGLCHLIPAFFVLACTAALFVVHPGRARFRWLLTMVPVAGLLTAFWVLPFWWNRDYVNDMGWERLPVPNSQESGLAYYLLPNGLKWVMAMAVVGVILSLLRRYEVGMVLTAAWIGVVVAFSWLPQSRLWNARLLPFMYLSVCLLAAIGLGELLRIAGALANGRPERPLRFITVPATALAFSGVLLFVSLPLSGMFPKVIDRKVVTVGAETKTESSFLHWFRTTDVNPAPGWAQWDYSGLETKTATPAGCDAPGSTVPCTSGGWPEYRDLMATMASIGRDPEQGCGRAFWEYDKNHLEGYGSPMAPMLLPYWTDGCIGSQEGLYFESSATVPYHFLMQSELSTGPSQPQREMPYPGFSFDAGVRHLQMLGVRYYLAVTSNAIDAASRHPDLTEIAVSGPWHIYRVADAEVVAPLTYEPVVLEGIEAGQHGWLPTATAWFLDPKAHDVPLALDGPDDWKRVTAKPVPDDWRRITRWTREQLGEPAVMDQLPDVPRTRLPANQVRNVELGNHTVSFDVTRPGVPVLVKVSYYPNWKVSGADGPYRVTPNLMVVVPTSRHVELSYGRSPVELVGTAGTALGLAGVVALSLAPPVPVPPWRPSRTSAWLDSLIEGPKPDREPEDGEDPDGVPDPFAGGDGDGDWGPPGAGAGNQVPEADDDIFVRDPEPEPGPS